MPREIPMPQVGLPSMLNALQQAWQALRDRLAGLPWEQEPSQLPWVPCLMCSGVRTTGGGGARWAFMRGKNIDPRISRTSPQKNSLDAAVGLVNAQSTALPPPRRRP
jgi:hypothetical protein